MAGFMLIWGVLEHREQVLDGFSKGTLETQMLRDALWGSHVTCLQQEQTWGP